MVASKISSIVLNCLVIAFEARCPMLVMASAGSILSRGSVLLFSMCCMMCVAVLIPTRLVVPFLLVPVVASARVFMSISYSAARSVTSPASNR